MDKEQELRPCPLCNAKIVVEQNVAGRPTIEIAYHPAGDCPIAALVFVATPDRIAAWNRRSSDEQAEVVGWRAVPGFGDKYEVSSSGQLRRADTLALRSPTRSGDGYLKVDLWHQNSRRQVLLHRLVAEAFVPRPEGADEVNHLDGNKHNNAASNLEWTDRRGNVDHFQYQLGKTVRPVLALSQDGSEQYYPSIEAAGRDGFNAKLISHVLNGHKKTHAGKRWVYTAFRSPASPPAVANGGVTEAQIKRAVDAALGEPENARRAADPDHPEADYAAGRVDAAQCVREALTASLAVRDEGIREGKEAKFTEDEIRNELYRREEAGRDPRVALSMPARFHSFSNSDLRSMLPTPPSRGEGV